MHYYETAHNGEAVAHDTLDDAIQYADANGINCISEIGEAWDEYEKCAFCGEWYTSAELNVYGDCERCVQAMKDHGGYRPPEKN